MKITSSSSTLSFLSILPKHVIIARHTTSFLSSRIHSSVDRSKRSYCFVPYSYHDSLKSNLFKFCIPHSVSFLRTQKKHFSYSTPCSNSFHQESSLTTTDVTVSQPYPSSTNSTPLKKSSMSVASKQRRKLIFDNKMTLSDFLSYQSQLTPSNSLSSPLPTESNLTPNLVPYLKKPSFASTSPSKFYIEVYGCQMNVNDTEILNAILNKAGYQRTHSADDADILFLMTCAIREGAESKIWTRLRQFKSERTKGRRSPMVGVLGCMAERLKSKLLEEDQLVDLVCGPDTYRHLPWLISLVNDDTQVANVMLSADETYADINPLRLHPNSVSATLSIMRGCNNMCSFCIVPFTRGIERSRPISSIVNEVKRLRDQGVREVVLLGQNVNSYRDTTTSLPMDQPLIGTSLSPGFSTIYKRKEGGLRFTELLDQVSKVDPEMRIRFTSPHPKDFPIELLELIQKRPNLCKQIHLPIQSGNTECLKRMRRGE